MLFKSVVFLFFSVYLFGLMISAGIKKKPRVVINK